MLISYNIKQGLLEIKEKQISIFQKTKNIAEETFETTEKTTFTLLVKNKSSVVRLHIVTLQSEFYFYPFQPCSKT
jgi:hypothetical protein